MLGRGQRKGAEGVTEGVSPLILVREKMASISAQAMGKVFLTFQHVVRKLILPVRKTQKIRAK